MSLKLLSSAVVKMVIVAALAGGFASLSGCASTGACCGKCGEQKCTQACEKPCETKAEK